MEKAQRRCLLVHVTSSSKQPALELDHVHWCFIFSGNASIWNLKGVVGSSAVLHQKGRVNCSSLTLVERCRTYCIQYIIYLRVKQTPNNTNAISWSLDGACLHRPWRVELCCWAMASPPAHPPAFHVFLWSFQSSSTVFLCNMRFQTININQTTWQLKKTLPRWFASIASLQLIESRAMTNQVSMISARSPSNWNCAKLSLPHVAN